MAATSHALRCRSATTPAREIPRSLAAIGIHDMAAAGLAALHVLSVGLTDGGYYGRSATPLTVAFVAIVGLAAITKGVSALSRAGLATLGLLAAFAAWTALSFIWAVPGALVEQDARRAVLYVCALGAVLSVADERGRAALLRGLLGGIAVIAVTAIGIQAGSGDVVDPFFGSLVEEPVGYPNALGALMAIGVVLTTGLDLRKAASRRATRGLAAVLVLVLGLSGSRGAAVALAVGLCTLVCLRPAGDRALGALRAVVPVLIGGLGWTIVASTGAAGGRLAVDAIAIFAVAAIRPSLDRVWPRRMLVALACGALVVGIALAATRPISMTSSYRTAYWAVALEGARAHPVLGTGAGSFHLTWVEHGPNGLFVRDAHSLYVEALSELGPVGLLLAVSIATVPLIAAARWRGDPISALSGAAFAVFVVHAGLDWDWEMPVVTLTALGCAGVALGRPSNATEEATA